MLKGFFLRTRNYMENTSIHGLKYIVDKDSHWIERIFWIIVCGGCVLGTYVLFVASWDAYKNNAVSFVMETTYLDWNATFPAVSVCEIRSRSKVFEFGNWLYGDDRNMNLDTYVEEIVFFGGVCYSCSSHCGKVMNCTTDMINLVKMFQSTCEELFVKCEWSGRPFNCCTNFLPLKTEFGPCYAINSIQTERISEGFETVDLVSNRFTGPGELHFWVTENVKVSIHAPEDVPYLNQDDEYYESVEYPIKFNFSILINDIKNDPGLAEVPIESRNCRFPYENNLRMYPYYSYSACIVECHAEAQMRLCGCVHHNMPTQTENSTDTCDIEGLVCLSTNSEELISLKTSWSDKPGLICNCMASCTEPEYNVIYQQDDTLMDHEVQESSTSRIRIALESLPKERFSRNVVRSRLDLVVSMGGTVGLFLGASLLSIVEVVYYFCIRSTKSPNERRINSKNSKQDKDSNRVSNLPLNNQKNQLNNLSLYNPKAEYMNKQQNEFRRKFMPDMQIHSHFNSFYPKDYNSKRIEMYM